MIPKQIETAQKEKKLVVGLKECTKLALSGKLTSIFIASNCNPEQLEELQKISALGNVELQKLDENSSELGSGIGKPFSVLIAGVKL